MGGLTEQLLSVRYLCVFHLPERQGGFQLGVTSTPVTDEGYDLQLERTTDSGAGAFGDIESVRPDGHPEEVLHLGSASGMVVYSMRRTTSVAQLLHDEASVTAHAVDRVSEVLGFAVEASALSWVHRLVIDADDLVPSIVPLAYASPAVLSRGGRALLGRGYSLVQTAHRDQIDAVELGIVSATQTWIMVDGAAKLAASLVTRVSSNEQLSADSARELSSTSIDLVLRVRLLSEFVRRLRNALTDARSAAFEATMQSWGLDRELTGVIDRVDSCSRLVMMQVDAKRAERDRVRNQLMFVLAFTAVSQWILAGYDFLVANDTKLGAEPRPLLDLLSAVPLLAIAAYGVVRLLNRRRR